MNIAQRIIASLWILFAFAVGLRGAADEGTLGFVVGMSLGVIVFAIPAVILFSIWRNPINR